MILNEVLDLRLHRNQSTGKTIHLTIFFNPDDKEGMFPGSNETEESFYDKMINYGATPNGGKRPEWDLDFDYEGLTKPVTDRINMFVNQLASYDAANGVQVDNDGNIYDYQGNPLNYKDTAPKKPKGYEKPAERLNQKEQDYVDFAEKFVSRCNALKDDLLKKIESAAQYGMDVLPLYKKWSETIKTSDTPEDNLIWSGIASLDNDYYAAINNIQKTLDTYNNRRYGKDAADNLSAHEASKAVPGTILKKIINVLSDNPQKNLIPNDYVPEPEKGSGMEPLTTFTSQDMGSKISSQFRYERNPNRLEWTLRLGKENGSEGVGRGQTRKWSMYVLNRLVPIAFYHMQMIANADAVKRGEGESPEDATNSFAGKLGQAFLDKFREAKTLEDLTDGLSAKDVIRQMELEGEKPANIDTSTIAAIEDNLNKVKAAVESVYEKYAEAYDEAQSTGDLSAIRGMIKNRIINDTNIYSTTNREMIKAQCGSESAVVKSKSQWAKEGRYVVPGAVPIGLIVPTYTRRAENTKENPEIDKIEKREAEKYPTDFAKVSQPKSNANELYKDVNLKMAYGHGFNTKSYIKDMYHVNGRFSIKFAYYTEEQTKPLYGDGNMFANVRNNDDVYSDDKGYITDKNGDFVRPEGPASRGRQSDKLYLDGFEDWCDEFGYDDMYSDVCKKYTDKNNKIVEPKKVMRDAIYNVAKNELTSEYGDSIDEILGYESQNYLKRQAKEITAVVLDAIGINGVAPMNKNTQLFPPSAKTKSFTDHANGNGVYDRDFERNRSEACWDKMRVVASDIYSTLADKLAQHTGKKDVKAKPRKDESLYAGLFDGQEKLNESYKFPKTEDVVSRFDYVPESALKTGKAISEIRKAFKDKMGMFK